MSENATLQAKLKQLEAENHALKNFTQLTAHQLQAPLRTLRNYSRLLADSLPDTVSEEAQLYLQFLESSGEQLLQLVTDLLKRARLVEGESVVEATDVNALLHTVCEEACQQHPDKTITFQLPEKLPTLNLDPCLIKVVFTNLIHNAIKYCRQAPVIAVEAKENQDVWQFSVIDNGIGIADDAKARLFQPFVRLHADDEFEGTGLGLYLCKSIIEAQGGQLGFSSVLGEGTRFYFTVRQNNT